jgi:hypothetical protein
MTEFQNAWNKASEKRQSNGDQRQSGSTEESQQMREVEKDEDATMKVAGKLAEVGGKDLSHEEKAKLGPVVHYSFGTLQGGIYGGVLEMSRVRGGLLPALAFGTALFTVADEIAIPALGLSDKPTETPLSAHLYGLISHLVYGISTDLARRGLRAAL